VRKERGWKEQDTANWLEGVTLWKREIDIHQRKSQVDILLRRFTVHHRAHRVRLSLLTTLNHNMVHVNTSNLKQPCLLSYQTLCLHLIRYFLVISISEMVSFRRK
jgi:hypothetical protein